MTDYDVYLFEEGKHSNLYERPGAHEMSVDGAMGTHFAVWALTPGKGPSCEEK
jgi:1,4-alpha-glucan branching enzyme